MPTNAEVFAAKEVLCDALTITPSAAKGIIESSPDFAPELVAIRNRYVAEVLTVAEEIREQLRERAEANAAEAKARRFDPAKVVIPEATAPDSDQFPFFPAETEAAESAEPEPPAAAD